MHLQHKRFLKHLWPMNGFLGPIRLTPHFYLKLKQGTLQFVLIKPLTAIFALVLDTYGLYQEGDFSLKSPYLYLSFINNFSVTVSLYCLGLFYTAAEERMRGFEPFCKFLCIKAIIFFSYWQSCFFQMLI